MRARMKRICRIAAAAVVVFSTTISFQLFNRVLDTELIWKQFVTSIEIDSEIPTLSSVTGSVALPPPRMYGNPNLTQDDVSHPHKGAMDEYNHFGYVHEPTILRYSPHAWPFVVSVEEEDQLCAPLGEGPEGYGEVGRQIFGERIRVVPIGTPAAPPTSSPNDTPSSASTITVFCAIYTHSQNNNLTDAIRETWGKRCDGFLAASTETVHEAATVKILHQGPHQGLYKGIWQRVRSMLGYYYDNFLDEYDFFFLAGDDTYVIMENLKSFLTSPQFVNHAGGPTYPKPVSAGTWVHPYWMANEGYSGDFYYLGGGAGYVLSRSAAVKALVETVLPVCHVDKVGSAEDVLMAYCLEMHLNVTGYDTRDDEERNRFFEHDVGRRVALKEALARNEDRVYGGYVRRQDKWLQTKHSWTPKNGIDCVSSSTISFHKVQPAIKMIRYERMIYRMRDERLDQLDCGRFYSRTNTTTSIIPPTITTETKGEIE
jgi:glycoprotein-N-acetylgalactosamine 3-beta-galactosyltransferase